mgnify:CR=1 FL=1
MYEEEDYLQLSGIQHFSFCRRQWALIHLEQQWSENVRTVEGKLLHEKAHDVTGRESRANLLISRAMPVCSRELGISGECDVVEFHPSSDGVPLAGRAGTYAVLPIEYKRGRPKESQADMLQLAAQAMCLEEMLCCHIPYGYLFYGETRRREKVEISETLREDVRNMLREMHGYFARKYTPKVKWSKSCNACSLQDICMPVLGKGKSAANYINVHIREES